MTDEGNKDAVAAAAKSAASLTNSAATPVAAPDNIVDNTAIPGLLVPTPSPDRPTPNLGQQVSALSGRGLALAEKLGDSTNERARKAKEWLKKLWQPLRWVLLVVAVFTLLALASVWNMRRAKNFSKAEMTRIQSLLQYSGKSAREAEQVERDDPLQALLYANYALCYLNACKHIVDQKTLDSLMVSAGVVGANSTVSDSAQLEQYLQALQHRQLERLSALPQRPPVSQSITPVPAI